MSTPDPFAGIDAELRAAARACTGREVARLERLSGSGLAHRRFYRVHLAPGEPATLIARVDRGEPAPGVPAEPPLEATRAFLEEHGLPVPRRFGGDAARAIDLIEDLGDVALADVLERAGAAERRALYEETCDLVPRLQRLADPGGRVPAFGRRLDAPLLRLKATRFARSGLPAVLGRPASDAERDVVFAAFEAVLEAIAGAPRRFAHRDFQSKNVLVRTGAPAGRRVAMIDLQGAFLAPPEYDLVCLLRDSYVELPDAECRSLAERVRPALPDAPPRAIFEQRFDLLTVTRKGKDYALFHEVASRGDDSWLRHAPATLGYLRRALSRVAALDARLARLGDLVGDGACAR